MVWSDAELPSAYAGVIVLLGISSYACTWAIGVPGHQPDHPMTAADLLQQAARLGVQVVQIADNLPLHTMANSELGALSARAKSLGLSVEVGARGIAPDHLLTYLRLAERFGSSLVRVVVDSSGHHPGPAEVVDALNQIMPAFERSGVCLAVENHDRFTARVLADIIRAVGSPRLGVCLDTVNSFGALEGPEVVLETLGPLTMNVHVKDFVVARAGHQMGFVIEGRPAGEGQLNVPWLVRRLRDLGRAPNLILELWPPPEATLAETIAKEHAWAMRSIDYLRSSVDSPC